jgi:CheY-like chemotaxis protein
MKLQMGMLDLSELLREVARKQETRNNLLSVQIKGLSGAEIRGDASRLRLVLETLITSMASIVAPRSALEANLSIDDDGLLVDFSYTSPVASPRQFARLQSLLGYINDYSVQAVEAINGEEQALLMSRRIIEAHGGKVWLDISGSKRTISLCFSLPFQDMQSSLAEFGLDTTPFNLPPSVFEDRQKRRPTVLVAEDDRDTISLLNMLLTEAGWNVLPARSGMDALRYLKANRPDLILIDLVMPDLDGFQTIQRMRELQQTKNGQSLNPPVVLMSAEVSGQESRLKMRELGVAGLLEKPFEPEEVRKLLDQILSASRR